MATTLTNYKSTVRNVENSANAYEFTQEVILNSQSVQGNVSNITVNLYANGINGWRYNDFYTPKATIYVNGEQKAAETVTSISSSKARIATWTGDIAHAEDGSMSLQVQTKYEPGATTYYLPKAYSYTSTSALPAIPRYSVITAPASAEMGVSISIGVEQKSDSFSHVLLWRTSSGEYNEIGRGTASSSYSWTVEDITEQLPNADSTIFNIMVRTYLNSEYDGDALESLKTLVATIPLSVVPSISITDISEANESIPNGWPLVAGFSSVAVTTSANGVKGSTVQGRGVQVVNEIITNTSADETTTSTFTQPLQASTSALATVTDSRGRTASASEDIAVYAYSKPTVALDCTRCESDGTHSAVGTYLNIRLKWTYDEVNGLNAANIIINRNGAQVLSYVPQTTNQSEWIEVGVVPGFSTSSQYTVEAVITDQIVEASVSQIVTKASVPFSRFDNGDAQGVSFGRTATSEGIHHFLEEHFYSDQAFKYHDDTVESYSNIKQFILSAIYPIGSIYISTNATNPATIFGGEWEQIKDTFLLSAGDTYNAGDTGGEATHTLTVDEMPSHTHDYRRQNMFANDTSPSYGYNAYSSRDASQAVKRDTTSGTGGGQAHNNMPPYLTVYMWERTA